MGPWAPHPGRAKQGREVAKRWAFRWVGALAGFARTGRWPTGLIAEERVCGVDDSGTGAWWPVVVLAGSQAPHAGSRAYPSVIACDGWTIVAARRAGSAITADGSNCVTRHESRGVAEHERNGEDHARMRGPEQGAEGEPEVSHRRGPPHP